MKKLLALAISAMLVASMLIVSVSAIGEEMTAGYGTPTIDGTIDAVWDTTEAQTLGYVKAGDLKGDGTMPEGLDVKVKVLWDNTALYFLFEITDDEFAFNSPDGAGHWKNDSIYLYVDEMDTYGATWNEGQAQIALIPADGLSLEPRNGTAPKESQLAWSFPTETTCVMEYKYVPNYWELAAGLECLIDFQYNDGDDAGTRPYCLGWSDETDSASGDSSIWGCVTLGEATAVEAPAEEAPAEEAPVTEAPAEEAPAEEAPVTEAPAEEAPVTAPQTSDITAVITLLAVVSALIAFAVSSKKALVK